MLKGEWAEGVGEETKEERFWHRTRGREPKVSGGGAPRAVSEGRTCFGAKAMMGAFRWREVRWLARGEGPGGAADFWEEGK